MLQRTRTLGKAQLDLSVSGCFDDACAGKTLRKNIALTHSGETSGITVEVELTWRPVEGVQDLQGSKAGSSCNQRSSHSVGADSSSRTRMNENDGIFGVESKNGEMNYGEGAERNDAQAAAAASMGSVGSVGVGGCKEPAPVEEGDILVEGGVLGIRLFKCENLPPKDNNGLCDPFVKLRLSEPSLRHEKLSNQWGVRRQRTGPIFQSPGKWKTINPVWDPPHGFELVVDDFNNASVQVEVWDRDSLSRNDFVGSFKLHLDDIDVERSGWLRGGKEVMESFTLNCSGGGEVFLSLEWFPFSRPQDEDELKA